jgi:hypothetical protein
VIITTQQLKKLFETDGFIFTEADIQQAVLTLFPASLKKDLVCDLTYHELSILYQNLTKK